MSTTSSNVIYFQQLNQTHQMNIHVYVHSYIDIPINYGKQNHTSARHKASTWSRRERGWRGKRRADERARGGQARRGWRREKLRQGLLTDSDGYHFIRDTILRLPQPTRSPSPSPMPPTTDLIWSEPTPIQTFTSAHRTHTHIYIHLRMYIRRLLPRSLLDSSSFLLPPPLPLSSLLSTTRFSVYPALVLLIFNGRRDTYSHTSAVE